MKLAPPSSSPALQPLLLPWDLRLNADQFERVCQANPDVVLELSADGQVMAMTLTGSETCAYSQALNGPLWQAPQPRRCSVLRCLAVSPRYAARWTFTWPMGPGWAGCCCSRNGPAEIWRADATANPERLDDAKTLDGGELFAGLVLDLAPIWQT